MRCAWAAATVCRMAGRRRVPGASSPPDTAGAATAATAPADMALTGRAAGRGCLGGAAVWRRCWRCPPWTSSSPSATASPRCCWTAASTPGGGAGKQPTVMMSGGPPSWQRGATEAGGPARGPPPRWGAPAPRSPCRRCRAGPSRGATGPPRPLQRGRLSSSRGAEPPPPPSRPAAPARGRPRWRLRSLHTRRRCHLRTMAVAVIPSQQRQ
mmetsp:Transcript_8611/g.25870  ORF Transcript_8611/g.25870 Transcript_8611/m.25870 type:complete len:211 (-) Transcript_8611:1242-1874(-)